VFSITAVIWTLLRSSSLSLPLPGLDVESFGSTADLLRQDIPDVPSFPVLKVCCWAKAWMRTGPGSIAAPSRSTVRSL
jgi:hypothetical protein